MKGKMIVEVGIPVATAISGDGRILSGVLPGGQYAVVVHVGPPNELERATADLLTWAREKGLVWDATPDQREWRARIESYLTDPIKEPDMNKWRTELAFLLA